MGVLYFKFVFCRALFLIIAIGNVTFFFFFWDYTTNLLKPSELKMKKTRFNGHLRVFCQQEYITIILSNVSTFPFVAIYVRLCFCHDALLITEWQSYLASRHIKQRLFRSGSQIWYHVTCNFLFFLTVMVWLLFQLPSFQQVLVFSPITYLLKLLGWKKFYVVTQYH